MNTTTDLITVSCDCGDDYCNGVVIELAASRLDFAKTPKTRRTAIHNYVGNRNKLALFGKLRIVKG